MRAAGGGKPVAFVFTAAQRLIGAMDYSSRAICRWLHQHGLRYTIPRRRDATHAGGWISRARYRLRNRSERLINRLKRYRRIATRYEKRARYYGGPVAARCDPAMAMSLQTRPSAARGS